MYPFRNKTSFYGEELLATRPTPKLADHPLSSVRDCLFNIFAATLHTGGPQPEEAPCRVDRDPLITDVTYIHVLSPHGVYLLVIAIHTVFARVICALFLLFWPLKNRGA
jgi:hypothetical protein